MTNVIYSIGAKFAGGGIGNIAYHGTYGLYRDQMLQKILCGSFVSSPIPPKYIQSMGKLSRILRKLAVYDQTYQINLLHNRLYDRWAALNLDAESSIFLGWGGFSLNTIRKAKKMGKVVIVQWASPHATYRYHLLQKEFSQWGLSFHFPRASWERILLEYQIADYILIPSDYVRQSFIKCGESENRLLQIPFGCDTKRFLPVEDRGKHPFRLLFVGQVGIRKGVPDLLKVWQLLNWPDAELWIVGRISSEMSSILKEFQGLQNIKMRGYVDDPAQTFQQADVFIFPTTDEGSALVTYEAMAAGLPVVTTQNAGSVIRDGREGFIVPIHDIDQFASRLEELRANQKLKADMSKAARQRALHYTWERHGKSLVEVINRIVLPGENL